MVRTAGADRMRLLRRVAFWGTVVVSAKVFLSILYQYRWYFPPDFDASPFLAGRRFTFAGIYVPAFYLHLFVGPAALLIGTFLIFTGSRPRYRSAHRRSGKLLFAIVLLGVVPSGLVMSLQAYAGPIAEIGFIVQSLLTGITIVVAAQHAVKGNVVVHRRWAARCYILLWSPLLLRTIAGVLIVLNAESEWNYRLNAWGSWLVPLLIYEGVLWQNARSSPKVGPHRLAAHRLETHDA